jgi:CheY-like chemotaxis protein
LGLGLSICDRLGRLLNHQLTLSSQPGRGSVFGVLVPRVAQARRRERLRAPVAPPDPEGLRGFRVLVVDNDLSILDAMQALLEHWGMRVFKALGSGDALAAIGSEPVDAVLADYHLGDGGNGLELIARIAEIRGSACMALITADHSAELIRAARKAGVPLLHKPVRPAALRALLSSFRLRMARGSAA